MLQIRFTVRLAIAALFGLLPALMAGAAPTDTTSDTAKPLDGEDGRDLALDQFRPKPMLKVAEHPLPQAKFCVVDVHTHPLARLHGSVDALRDHVRLMDQHNLAVSVSLDGGMRDVFDEHKKYLWTDFHDRFVILANIDWRGQGEA